MNPTPPQPLAARHKKASAMAGYFSPDIGKAQAFLRLRKNFTQISNTGPDME